MAQITVTGDDGRLVHREWVLPLQADSDHFLGCLAERLRWAIRDTDRGPAVQAPAGAVQAAAERPSAVATDPSTSEPAPVAAEPPIAAASATVEEYRSREPVLVG